MTTTSHLPRIASPIVLIVLAVILLGPIWVVPYPPLMDYPNHLASSFVLAHLQDVRFKFSEMYQAHWGPYPYMTMEVVLVALQRIMPVELAGRIFMSMCLLALPLAVWYFMREASPGHDALALWSLPLAYNQFFLIGYLSYYLGIAVCFVALGLWMQYLARPSLRRWIGLVAALTLLYFTHIIGFAVAALVLTALGLLRRCSLRQLVLVWLALLPGVVMLLITLAQPGAIAHQVIFEGFRWKVASLMTVLHASRLLRLIILIVLVGGVVVASWRNSDFHWNQDWLVISILLLVVYLVLPAYVEPSDVDARMLPFLYLVMLAIARVGHRTKWLAIGAILLFLLHTGESAYQFVRVQPRLAILASSFETIPLSSRVLPLVDFDYGTFYYPYLHFWAYGVVRKGWLVPFLFADPWFTLRLRDAPYSPKRGAGYKLEEPGWERVRSAYDYVWAYDVSRFTSPLGKIGKLVFAQGNLNVYQMNIRGHGGNEHNFDGRGGKRRAWKDKEHEQRASCGGTDAPPAISASVRRDRDHGVCVAPFVRQR